MGRKLKIDQTSFNGVYLITTDVFKDVRGTYSRWFCESELSELLGGKRAVNINHQRTNKKGTVRGLHYQVGPYAESKIIRCIHGKMADVIVDIRPDSPTFLKYAIFELSSERMDMLYVPEGFAHGFQALTDDCETMYITPALYNPESERGLNPLDPALKISWPLKVDLLSEKDRSRPYIDSTFQGWSI